MLSTLCELDAESVNGGTSHFAASSRLHFWLGMLSEEKLLEEILYDSLVLGILKRIARAGHTPRLAARALTLTVLALKRGRERDARESETVELVTLVFELLEAGLQGFETAANGNGEEIFEALRGLLETAPQALRP